MRFAAIPAAGRVALPVLLLLVASPSTPQSPRARADESVAQGASLFARGDLKGAHESYLQAIAVAPGHFSALHRLARVESELSQGAQGEEGRSLVAAAVEHAREAVKAQPDSAAGHLELAVALGRQALKEGPKTQLSLSREIKSEVDRALALDPSLGRGWHVLALWNRKLASLGFLEKAVARTILGGVPRGASMDNAVDDLKKAVGLEPAYVNHHLELGRTYLQLKRRDEARRELEQAVALPPTSDPLDPKYQAEARELLGKLKKG
jgi:tetratricopeptide (TPR) repeat protein